MPDGRNQKRSNEQVAFATIGIVAHAASRKHPWAPISSQAANRGNTPFPQVKDPYNPKIVRGFFKDTPIRTSVSTSQNDRIRGLLSALPLLRHESEQGRRHVHANGRLANRGTRFRSRDSVQERERLTRTHLRPPVRVRN